MENSHRKDNIKKQNKKLQEQIIDYSTSYNKNNVQIIDAVMGNSLNLNELINTGKLSEYFNDPDINANKRNVIGCYLSHLKIYNIISTTKTSGYSIIFEDDFEITNDFYKTMMKAVKTLNNNNIDFDMLFLGILPILDYNKKEQNIIDNIEFCSGVYAGCHGYLINNEKADKIYNSLKYMYEPIDIVIFKQNIDNKLIVYKLKDSIVNQNVRELKSFNRSM